jgi:hypothetical protein
MEHRDTVAASTRTTLWPDQDLGDLRVAINARVRLFRWDR